MSGTQFLGLAAGGLTTVAFLPQVVKTYRSKSAKDLSYWMLTAFSVGVLLWLIYGVVIDSIPIIVTNGVTLLLAATNLLLKVKYD